MTPQSAREAKGRDAKVFTFDRMERLLTYCVPLAVDPRSPQSRVNDVVVQKEEENEGEIPPVTSSMESKQTDEESVSRNVVVTDNYNDPRLQSRSIESIPNIVTEGLLEHTNRLREKMMDRTRSSSGAVTTPARMLEHRMELQGRGGNNNEREMENHEEPSSVLVPGGLWSLPSDERYGTHSLSQSFMDSRSMHSSRSGEERRAKNPYYCGNDVDDVLLMRSMSDGGSDELSGELENRSSESSSGENNTLEKNHLFERAGNLALDTTTAGLDGDDIMEDVMNAAAMNAVNGLLSPRSLASEDKYMLEDDTEERNDEREDPYADAHELSHYHRDANELASMYQGEAREARDDNEAVNRHFDNLISDFELNIRQEDNEKVSSSRLSRHKQFQEKKKLVKRSREHRKVNSPRMEDDTVSKTSHMSDHSTALFLHSTTMGRKLNRSTPTSPGSVTGSLTSSRESVLDRARHAVTSVHQVMGSRNKTKETMEQKKHADKVVNRNVPVRSKLVESAQKKKSVDTLIRQVKAEGLIDENDTANQESSPISTYKKRLMEQRSRRIKREFASKGEENEDIPKIPHITEQKEREESHKTNPVPDTLLREPTHEEANLDICVSGTSFDSSVNWDALAYSMSGSMSLNGVQASQQNDIVSEAPRHETAKAISPESTSVAPSPKNQYQAMGRIDQIKKQHDQKMAQLRMGSLDTAHQPDRNRDAPDDECDGNNTIHSRSQEENMPLSPNSIDSNDFLSHKTTNTSISSTVQVHIEAMKRQIVKEMMNNERHHDVRIDFGESSGMKSPGSSRQRPNRFNFDRQSPKKPSTEDLMLNNMMLEEEMEHIRALSPTNLPSPKSPISSPRSRKQFNQHGMSSPLSPKSPSSHLYGNFNGIKGPFTLPIGSPKKNQDKDYTPEYYRNHQGKCVLKVEIPTSPISTPRRTARLTTSPKMMSRSVLSPRSPSDNRTRTRVSDLMEEVKGFLAENDRARERIATDLAAMQAMRNY